MFLDFADWPEFIDIDECEEAGVLGSPGDISCPPDSRRLVGTTLPLIMVWECSESRLYEVMDMVRSSGRSGTTRPWAVVLAM